MNWWRRTAMAWIDDDDDDDKLKMMILGFVGWKLKKGEGRGEMAVLVCLGPLRFLFFSFFLYIKLITKN